MQRTSLASRSTLALSRPTASLTRRPAPYSNSTSARSRSARGVVPEAASTSRSASAGERVLGSARRRRGRSSSAAGLAARSPSSVWWRKNDRIAATRRPMVAGDSPAARNSARYCSSCSVVILPIGRSSQAASAVRSRRYASTVLGARRVASSARNPSTSVSTMRALSRRVAGVLRQKGWV